MIGFSKHTISLVESEGGILVAYLIRICKDILEHINHKIQDAKSIHSGIDLEIIIEQTLPHEKFPWIQT